MDKQLSGGLLLNLVAPGFGHIYCGEKKKGLIILSGYPLIIVHLYSYRMNYGADHCVI
ncbi:hypothetical protein [Caldibacillus debilis]|jgi:hypothetical protein|uniref:Uncharacterized protein n=1 Tax=Caldibacillus debilis GB1 TaxID=1339248 RepID=A0A420VJH6_9BACI|nr:hypothetical protein [Caldibacillus debilis]RKO63757.1 hypothetical protein Cdeb_02557 [Caldibacillus debilis GB1]